ncbi:MAG TPA: hypothetical protein VMV18_07640, partial [bacterium]|nr:hypothetical protein [bacterium]
PQAPLAPAAAATPAPSVPPPVNAAPVVAQARPAASELSDTVRMPEPPLARREVTATPEPTPVLGEPTPIVRAPEPTPVMAEDPVQMALRLAAQATQQAAAMASKAPTPSEVGETTGVAMRWSPPQSAIGARAAAPAAAAAVASTEVGVVPEEPDNEPTRRGGARAEVSETTEPTMPSSAVPPSPAVPEERTPLLVTGSGALMPDEDAIPDVRDDVPIRPTMRPEPTPAMRAPPFPEPPPEEVTVRKASPPPPLAVVKPLVRSGFGPASIGALGIRVVTSRPIVRPAAGNGRAAAPAGGDTQISQSNPIPRFEPARQPSGPSGIRAPAPAPVIDTVARASGAAPAARAGRAGGSASLILYGGVGAGVAAIILVAGYLVLHHGSGTAGGVGTPTPVAEASGTPEDAASPAITAAPPATAAPTATVVEATPAPTHRLATTATPARTALVATTPTLARTAPPATPTPTQVAIVSTPHATPTVVITPRLAPTPVPAPTMKESSRRAIEDANRFATAGDPKKAMTTIFLARASDGANEELSFLLWNYAAASGDKDTLKFANEYKDGLNHRFATKPEHLAQVNMWLLRQRGTP